jgi:hypothetical protein
MDMGKGEEEEDLKWQDFLERVSSS